MDLQSTFQVSTTPTLGAPVFLLDYLAQGRPPVWWRRWLALCRRRLGLGRATWRKPAR